MADLQAWVAQTYDGLADLLGAAVPAAWDTPSLCEGWQVRHVVAHVTMPARFTPQQFGAELGAAGGDFGLLSDRVAVRDASLPVEEHLAHLRSPLLHGWQPPGGGEVGALFHAVIHSLDVTVALAVPPVAPEVAVCETLDRLTAANGEVFGVDLSGVRLDELGADPGSLVALVSGRALPDGTRLPRQAS